MSFESLRSTVQRLGASAEALAALGAELRLRQEGTAVDPRIAERLRGVVRLVDPQLLDHLEPNDVAAALALVNMVFGQALDLMENPRRAPGWQFQDPTILQSQGRLSRVNVRGIEAIATQTADLRSSLRQSGMFLDVGTGVGWLAIEAARTWPALRVVGIDPWEPALALARENRANSDVAERVELRRQRVEDLTEMRTFTVVWLPGPFIASEVAGQALRRVHDALSPGGWLIFGCYAPATGKLEEALTQLRDTRNGGHPWTTSEVEERLGAHNFEEIRTFSPSGPIRYVIGRRRR